MTSRGLTRRELLASATLAFAGALPAARVFAQPPDSGARHFDFAALKGKARALAERPYVAAAETATAALAKLDFDRYQKIVFRHAHALWADTAARFRVEYFHLGMHYRRPVRLFEIVDGEPRPIGYDPGLFDLTGSGLDPQALPSDLGFAGWKLFFHTDWSRDVAAFLGASYFRAVGASLQYGLSARGLAIDTGLPKPEEFPDFTAFWLDRPGAGDDTLTVYALLDSPSVAGAYRFAITPGARLAMQVDCALYPRRAIERLGIAPATSMFLTAPNDRRVDRDWRPAVHDSDGLAMWTGHGERIWRPLVNPADLHVSRFADRDPRCFGLLQRDCDFDDYEDTGARYDLRPDLVVEPAGEWGTGAVVLVEIPTAYESFDNIVAFWNPGEPIAPGSERLFGYRLTWGATAPDRASAHVTATRTGIGGQPGGPAAHFAWRFVVDFAGGTLPMLAPGSAVEPVIGTSAGTVEHATATHYPEIAGWRVVFDLRPPPESTAPIDIRLFLRLGGQALSETWLYQWAPPPRR